MESYPYTIPYKIGDLAFNKALYDIGDSVSLMPYSIFKKIDLGELKPTTMCISMANKSIKYPLGVLENVPTKVGKCIIPTDFVVMDMEEDPKAYLVGKKVIVYSDYTALKYLLSKKDAKPRLLRWILML